MKMKLTHSPSIPNWLKFLALILLVSLTVALMSYALVVLNGLNF